MTVIILTSVCDERPGRDRAEVTRRPQQLLLPCPRALQYWPGNILCKISESLPVQFYWTTKGVLILQGNYKSRNVIRLPLITFAPLAYTVNYTKPCTEQLHLRRDIVLRMGSCQFSLCMTRILTYSLRERLGPLTAVSTDGFELLGACQSYKWAITTIHPSRIWKQPILPTPDPPSGGMVPVQPL